MTERRQTERHTDVDCTWQRRRGCHKSRLELSVGRCRCVTDCAVGVTVLECGGAPSGEVKDNRASSTGTPLTLSDASIIDVVVAVAFQSTSEWRTLRQL